MKEYDSEEYNNAQETVDFYNARAITVLRNCGVKEVLKWFDDCEETFVNVYDKAVGTCQESIVRVVLWMGYEYEPSHRVFEFPWKLMNIQNDKISEEYAKWRKEEDAKLAAAKEVKDKYWAAVRDKYVNGHYGIEITAKRDSMEHRLSCFDLVTVGKKPCVDACIEVAKILSSDIKRKTLDGVTFIWGKDWEVSITALETMAPSNEKPPEPGELAKTIESRLSQAVFG